MGKTKFITLSYFLLTMGLTLALISACSRPVTPPQSTNKSQPNIIVVLCDDLGYGDLECYGHPQIKTPRLNLMAKEGIRFTDFYSAAPVCSPARVGLLTGRSPNRAGIYDFIPGGKKIYMAASEITIPKLLKTAGYATCLSGKWHCNGRINSEQPQPNDAGFDHWFATQNNARPTHKNPANFFRNGKKVGALKGYSCQLVVDEALTWLTGQQKSSPEQPFFMYVAFHEPHEPVASPPELVSQYQDGARNEAEAQYFANVANIDAAVGKLLDGLKERDLDQNTLVIFTSDNGPETLNRHPRAKHSYGTAEPLRGMKLWTTEAGFRVAGIMRWPERIQAGQLEKQVVSSLDFLPTFCDLAGIVPPAELTLDGANFLPALNGKTIAREKPLTWVFYNALNEHRVAMREGDWKIMATMNIPQIKRPDQKNEAMIKAATLSNFQLFNMTHDMAEQNDLSDSEVDQLKTLKQRLELQYRDLVDDSPILY